MMRLSNFHVAHKLLLVFGASFSAVLCTCTMIIFYQSAALRAAHVSRISSDAINDIHQVSAGLYDQNASIRGLVLFKAPRFIGRYRDAARLIDQKLGDARLQVEGDLAQAAEVDSLAAAVKAWQQDIGNRAVSIGADPTKFDQVLPVIVSDRATEAISQFRAALDHASKSIGGWSDQAQIDEDTANAQVRLVAIIGTLASLGIMVSAWLILSRALGKPLVSMTMSMRHLATGNHSIEVPFQDQSDEIGQMAAAVQVFKEAAIEKSRLEQETARTRQRGEEARAHEEKVRRKTAEDQALVVSAIAQGLERLSEGDLLFRLEQPFASEYEKLRAAFNGAIGKLQDTLTIISGSTSAIRSGTNEISTAADDLSRRTEQQASSLEETAAALDEITATVKKTAAGATQARAVVSTAKGDAEHSGEVVSQAVEAMSAIEASSQKIGQIIGVIDEIAFQTNLLALNAGVEAARAGEAGRGFAVVASEVRALAQRSAEAAKEIKALISASARQVSQGVDLVGETGKALGRIVSQVAEINTIVADIAASAIEQSTGLDQVNTAINQMDQVTQQNAAMVEESTAASTNLAQEAEELVRLIGQFKVEASIEHGFVRARVKPAPRPVRALKTSGAGGVARKPAAQVEQSWEEF